MSQDDSLYPYSQKKLKGAVRKYVSFFQRGANWVFDGVFRAKLVSEDAFSLC